MRRTTITTLLLLLALCATAAAQDKTGLAVTLPARVKGDLELLGEKHQIEFAIPAPGLLKISLTGKSGVTPNLEIFDPSDAPVDASGYTTTSSTKVKVSDFPVSEEGTWKVHVSDAGVETGSYKLKISFARTDLFTHTTIPPPSPAGIIAQLTFRGEPGDVAKIKLKRTLGDATPRVDSLVAPDATTVDLSTAKTSESSKKQKIKKIAITQSGDHEVNVVAADGTDGGASIQVTLDFDLPAKMKVDYSGDDFSEFDSTTAVAHVDLDDISDYRLALYDASTRLRLDLPTPTQKFDSTGTRRVRIPNETTLLGLLVPRDYTPPLDGSSLAIDGVNVFDMASQGDITSAAGLLRFTDVPQPVDPAASIFVNTPAHHTVLDTYDLIGFCMGERISTVFYPGEWPTEGNGTLPGRDGGSGAGNVSPHVTASGALGVFASALDAHGIDLVLVYDDANWLTSPTTATARASEIAGYNASASASEDIDGALVALDFVPTGATGAPLCDLLLGFATALTNAPTYVGTFPAYETLSVTWNAQNRPLTEQCIRVGDGIVHHARRTTMDGPDSITEAIDPLLNFGADLGLTNAIWVVLDTTDRTAVGGAAEESFFGRPTDELRDTLVRIQGFDAIPSSAGAAILDRAGFEALPE